MTSHSLALSPSRTFPRCRCPVSVSRSPTTATSHSLALSQSRTFPRCRCPVSVSRSPTTAAMELPDSPHPSPDDPSLAAAVRPSGPTRDWASLPGDLLVAVASHLISLADFSSLRRVCSTWRSYAVPSAATLASQPPLVMLHVQNRILYHDSDPICDTMSETEAEHLDRPTFDVVFLDLVRQRYYRPDSWSSWRSFNALSFSHGYVAKALGDGRVLLSHVFTDDKIWLPKTGDPFSDSTNIICSENPSSPWCLFVLYSFDDSTVEFCQRGDISWKSWNVGSGWVVMDMVFFQGKFYALMCWGYSDEYQLASIEFTPKFILKPLGKPENFLGRAFLFTSGYELLLSYPRTIFSWDFGCNRWIRKSNLDGRALFLTKNRLTACVDPTPGTWIKPNYKYYFCTDNYVLSQQLAVDGPDYEDGVVEFGEYPTRERLYDFRSPCVGRAVWIFPSLCFSN